MSIQIRNLDSKEYKQHHEWMKTLKVGDTICDCRFKHVKILQIEEDTIAYRPSWVRRILFANWIPFFISNLLDDMFAWISRKVGNLELVDKTLVLEDQSHCSAMHCCHPADHEWQHPSEEDNSNTKSEAAVV